MQVSAINFENAARKSKIKMLFLIAGSVLFCAFAYGFAAGLKTPAYANLKLDNSRSTVDFEGLSDIPAGIKLIPVGDDVSIKGHKAVIANFVTSRSVEEVLGEQREIWERRGINTIGALSSSRGTLAGDDQMNHQRRMMVMWEVPPTLRKVSSNGYSFQGIISQVSGEISQDGDSDQFARSLGVQTKPGSEGGVVFSSRDNGFESRTASFVNPGSVADNVNFYEVSLKHSGWSLSSKERLGEGDLALIKLDFNRQEQLLHVLISPVERQSFANRDGADRSVVNITRMFVAAK